MIKMVATANNRTMLVLGLDRENTRRLHAGEPIVVDLQAVTAQTPQVQDIVIVADETLTAVHAELAEHFDMPPYPEGS